MSPAGTDRPGLDVMRARLLRGRTHGVPAPTPEKTRTSSGRIERVDVSVHVTLKRAPCETFP
jgi:hypothetical protein